MKKIFLDTNVLVRYFIQTPREQFLKSKEIILSIEKGETSGLVSILVVDELIWVLENYYHLDRRVFIPEILKVFGLKKIKIIEGKKEILLEILMKMENTKIDLTDYYLLALSGGNDIATFDEDLLRLIKQKSAEV